MQIKKKYIISTLVLSVMLIISIIIAVSLGSSDINFIDANKILINNIIGFNIFKVKNTTVLNTIIWDIRMPRVILAGVAGAGLAVCGILIQTITKNPISDSYILGISSGASMGAVFIIILGGATISITFGAFIGALICGILVLIIGTAYGRTGSGTKLILTGVAISAVFSGLTNFIIYSSSNSNQASAAMFWIMGSFGGAKWNNIIFPIIILAIVIAGSIIFSKTLDVLSLGDISASTLGINVIKTKIVIVIAVTILTSAIVSVTGTIGFVGIIIPHIARKFIGANHNRVTIISIFLGAIFLILSDLFSRIIFAPRELPIGIITAIIGGPFFIWFVIRNKKRY